MAGEAQVSYEEYIPSDRYTIQDMYFWGIQLLRQDYAKIMRGWYNNSSRDTRAMIEFFADADGFYWFANENMIRFTTETDKAFLKEIFENGKADINKVEQARQVFQVLMRFAAKSKLTDLSESRPMGDFAYARQKLGILKPREA
jgi:hypothetical protein